MEGVDFIGVIKKKRVYEEIVEQVEKLIMNGELQPGDKLPSTDTLAKLFQVSKSSVREALVVLEAKNRVGIIQGKGIVIRS